MAAHGEIAAAWPEVIAADGGIDRKKLGAIVFSDPKSQARLEAITTRVFASKWPCRPRRWRRPGMACLS